MAAENNEDRASADVLTALRGHYPTFLASVRFFRSNNSDFTPHGRIASTQRFAPELVRCLAFARVPGHKLFLSEELCQCAAYFG